ncbi:hypothetical protein AAG593_09355 [Citromicrobium bathyomarinum]|uniref:hypothetical protein n=1 Tax=unclassified Citromicrobium TaxID=2630544 RepID=UPI0006C92B2C|nr:MULTISPECIES: hypothetical protein [unclassified Citromicrobium]KPM20377.1 hypothetical protein VO57_15755 [Citromicrobium sp. JL2201]KPM23045.1 hypothetical protein AAJ72_08980 [Citromicrobium sp. RCC1885]KPM27187.1 hypothetical protein AAJ74_09720 [Citromicrobium sp. RCC1878]OAM09041.1 hypothetical protein A0U43_10580 [Citromicrobium sp. RCC1897]
MSEPISFSHFLLGWVPALAATSVVPEVAPELADTMLVVIGGVPIPLVTCVLGFLGVIMARPLARKSESALSWPLFLLVTAIMLILVELWIVESRPRWLFAFVIAIGLGFSGYSLIELLGDQMRDFIKDIVGKARGAIGIDKNGTDT